MNKYFTTQRFPDDEEEGTGQGGRPQEERPDLDED